MSKSCRDMSQFERLFAFVQIDGNTEVANLGGARRRTQKGRDRLSQQDGHTQLRILRKFEYAKTRSRQGINSGGKYVFPRD